MAEWLRALCGLPTLEQRNITAIVLKYRLNAVAKYENAPKREVWA